MDMVHGDWAVEHGVLACWYMESDPWYMESGTWRAWYMVTLTRMTHKAKIYLEAGYMVISYCYPRRVMTVL